MKDLAQGAAWVDVSALGASPRGVVFTWIEGEAPDTSDWTVVGGDGTTKFVVDAEAKCVKVKSQRGVLLAADAFHCTRACGVLARAWDGLIARNEITDTGLPAVLLESEPWWLEGGTPLGTRVEDNTVLRCRAEPPIHRKVPEVRRPIRACSR